MNNLKPNLISFSDFSCGGILVTLLNNQKLIFNDSRLHGSTESNEHNLLKLADNWENKIKKCRPGVWYSTHLLLDKIDLEKFDNVICITTEQVKSQLVVFKRVIEYCYPNTEYNNNLDEIDKIRELCKEYVFPRIRYKNNKSTNIELIDFLNEKSNLIDYNLEQWKIWKSKNSYLYKRNEWIESRFNEASWEIQNNKPFKYQ